MEKYHSVLNERWIKSNKIEMLERTNGELKRLLREYMGANINDELQVPPTQILLSQAGLLRGK